MPRNPQTSNKKRTFLTENKLIVSLRSKKQPLTQNEKVMLNKIYNESIFRLKRSITLLDQLETRLSGKAEDEQRAVQNIKQFLINDDVEPELLHTFKMLKRHFYIDITNNSIANVLSQLAPVRHNLLRTYKGLKGRLEVALEIFDNEPDRTDIANFKNNTYVLVHQDDCPWSLSFYENKIKKADISIDDVDPQINNIPDIRQAKFNRIILLRTMMSYHATHMKTQKNKVYISNIARKKQNNPTNTEIGYVWYTRTTTKEYYGAIHIDYRLLETNPMMALRTLIHEASHRYAWVMDRGYYHGTKVEKKTGLLRPYPNDVNGNRVKATNNADSYTYFVTDLTGPDDLFDDDNLPEWCNEEKVKPLPKESNYKNALVLFSAITVAGIAVGGLCYLGRDKIFPNQIRVMG